jgi:hypothetical protein
VGLVSDPDTKLLSVVLLGAALAGAAWYFWDDIRPANNDVVIGEPNPIAEVQPATREPLHPITPSISSGVDEDELIPLPALDESDTYFLLELVDIFGVEVERLLVNEALIDKFVATVDNLTRSHVAEKIRPVGRLPGTFSVEASDVNGPYYLNPDNYHRYDTLVSVVTAVDPALVVAMYRRFYPLFQESYVRLGYPGAYFNDRVVDVIDQLLLTPEPTGPIQLVQPHVLYEFADPELEALSSGQKLMLRMGSDHTVRMKRVLRDLRGLVSDNN